MTIPARWWTAVWLCFLVVPVVGAAPDRRLDIVRALRATRMGVDHVGHLWAWNAGDGTVSRLAPNGSQGLADIPTGVTTVDADAEFGIATLSASGQVVDIYNWRSGLVGQLKVANSAGNVCWLNASEIALAPKFAAHRVEVWNVTTRSLVRTIGAVPRIVPKYGATRARGTLLLFDSRREELVTVEAYDGEIVVYSPRGEVLRTAKLSHPRLGETNQWLAELDAQKRAARETFTPLIWRYPMAALTSDGTLCFGEENDPDGTVRVIKVFRNGTVQRATIMSPDCSSIRFQSWEGYFIFFRDPLSPQQICTAVRKQ